jgi:hypothetical protein
MCLADARQHSMTCHQEQTRQCCLLSAIRRYMAQLPSSRSTSVLIGGPLRTRAHANRGLRARSRQSVHGKRLCPALLASLLGGQCEGLLCMVPLTR